MMREVQRTTYSCELTKTK